MILKVTAGQAGRVRKLARGKCCNCMNGNCLLLDDGGENRCVQLISRYGVYCISPCGPAGRQRALHGDPTAQPFKSMKGETS